MPRRLPTHRFWFQITAPDGSPVGEPRGVDVRTQPENDPLETAREWLDERIREEIRLGRTPLGPISVRRIRDGFTLEPVPQPQVVTELTRELGAALRSLR